MARAKQEGSEPKEETRFNATKRGVTPVIGIILLVAIAAILAAIISTFALGLGDRVQDYGPNTQFGFDYDPSKSGETCELNDTGDTGKLTISHRSGDIITEGQLMMVDDEDNSAGWNDCAATSVTEIESTDKTIPEIDSDDTIKLIWESENKGGDTAVLATYEGPDA